MQMTICIPFSIAIFSGNCKMSFSVLFCMLYSNDIEKSFIGSAPIEILGLMCERNCLVFSIHSSHLEEVCFKIEVAKRR